MNGENNSASVSLQEKIHKIDVALAEYEQLRGLPPFKINGEAEKYLNISLTELRQLSSVDCAEAAVLLAEFAFSLQRSYNEEMAKVNWATDEIRHAIAQEIKQYTAPSAEERKLLAIQGNEYAAKLDKICRWTKAKADRLAYLAGRAEFLGRTLMSLHSAKREMNNGD